MDPRISRYVLLVCVWCSLDAGRLLRVVTAQPEVKVEILTPEADRKEGGQIDMRCTAMNLEPSSFMEWRKGSENLRWNGASKSPKDQHFTFQTTKAANDSIIENLTIYELHKSDAAMFVCNVQSKLLSGGTIIVATDSVTLSVLYFPGTLFPVCSPAGPITGENGTVLNMKCLSELGNPPVSMEVFPMSSSSCYKFSGSIINGSVFWSLDAKLLSCDANFAFECVISSDVYSEKRSCVIGAVDVMGQGAPTRPLPELESLPWIVAFGVAAFLLILSSFVIICLLIRIHKQKHNTKAVQEHVRAPGSAGYESQLSENQLHPASRENVFYDQPTQEYDNVQYPIRSREYENVPLE